MNFYLAMHMFLQITFVLQRGYTYYNPGWIIQNNDIGDKGDKGSSIVIMKK